MGRSTAWISWMVAALLTPAWARAVVGAPRTFNPVVNPAPASGSTTPYPLYHLGQNVPGVADAVCNDGSPVVYGYLPPRDPTSRKWMVFLEGGSHCSGLFSCLQRWMETPDRMSTTYAPPGAANPPMAQRGSVSLSGAFLDTAAQGLPSNRLRDEFHQVWVNYCSSDAWHGDGLYQDQRVNPVTGNGLEEVINSWKAQLLGSSDRRVQAQGLVLSLMQPSFLAHFCVANQCSVHFAGAKIVEALLEDLRLNRGLTNPQMILLAGSSAGSMGVRQNLDRLARAARNRWPRVVVVGASDSGHYAEPLNEVAARQPLPSLDSSCSVLGAGPVYPTPLLLPAVTATGAQFWGSARVDETCLRTRLGGPAPVPATPAVFQAQDECREHDRLLPAIATPLFLFQGYRDRVFLPDGAANNVSCNNPAGISPAVTRASYNELLASARGVFGVDSEIHTSLQSTSFFNLLRTDLTVSASPLSHYTILWNWLKTRGTYRHAILECPPGCAVACGTQACP